MKIESDFITGKNKVNFTNSLNAPLLYLKLSVNSETIIPDTNDLIIYVDNDEDGLNRKTYAYTLNNKLQLNDQFIIESKILNNNLNMTAYIKNEEKLEYIDYEPINTFDGNNYLSTNYENIEIELIYPENNDLSKRYLLNSIYNESESINEADNNFNAFTKDENGINLDVNNLNVGCITNSNNNFSVDTDGNILANSITLKNGVNLNYEDLFDKIYPVGSIYISVNNINPSTIFTGTWEEFARGRTLVGVDESQNEFNEVLKTGGNKLLQSHIHTGTTNVTGSHQHTGNTLEVQKKTSSSSDCARNISSSYDHVGVTITNPAGDHSHTFTTESAGAGDSGNLQPYITCYIWKRIS